MDGALVGRDPVFADELCGGCARGLRAGPGGRGDGRGRGRGSGSALIRHGLDALRARGVDVALTYGDPAYYGRIGFRPITTEIAAAPYPLQFPHGWLGQALDGGPLRPLVGEVACVPALADPAFW
jgi:putative acetyltransferase